MDKPQKLWLRFSPVFKVDILPRIMAKTEPIPNKARLGTCACGSNVIIVHRSDPDDDNYEDNSVVRCVGDGCKERMVLPGIITDIAQLRSYAMSTLDHERIKWNEHCARMELEEV